MKSVRNSIFIIVGVILIGCGTYLIGDRYTPLSQAKVIEHVSENSEVERIVIESIGVDLPIIPTKQSENGQWPTTTLGVSYDESSAVPGSVGTAVMYGHNWPRLLGELHKVKEGDEIVIRMDDGHDIRYKVAKIWEVSGDGADIVNQSTTSQLIIYTCTGFLDSRRLIVAAIGE